MTSQAHMLLNTALFTRKNDPRKYFVAAMLSGFIPDMSMIFFYIIEKFIHKTPESVLWLETYFRDDWQRVFNIGHSIPLAVLLLLLGLYFYKVKKNKVLLIISEGMILHDILDLLLHYDDGHAHFYPFSDYIFASPISYWDPKYYGLEFSIFEIFLLLTCAIYIFRRIERRWIKYIFSAIVLLMIGFNSYMLLFLATSPV